MLLCYIELYRNHTKYVTKVCRSDIICVTARVMHMELILGGSAGFRTSYEQFSVVTSGGSPPLYRIIQKRGLKVPQTVPLEEYMCSYMR